jgi:hypothetical protein
MIKYFLMLHIMVANPKSNIPNVYDYWFQEPELRYYATEKDCIEKANEIMEWSKAIMEQRKLTVIQQSFDCIEVEKNEASSPDHKLGRHKAT